MGYTHGTAKDAKRKICTKCNMEFPNTLEYFGYANKKQERLEAVCKECKKLINKKKREEVIQSNIGKDLFYDGNKQCIKCKRELPNNKLFFPIDLSCKTGLRNKCRECDPKNGNFLEENYKISEKWTDNEIKLLESIYADYTGKEIQEKFFPNRTVRAIECAAKERGFAYKSEETRNRRYENQSKLMSEIMKGRVITDEWRINISKARKEYFKTHDGWWKGRKRSKEQRNLMSINAKERGLWKGDKNPRHINPLNGELNGRWKGGILDTYTELRSDTKDWFNESAKFCNYNCVITGKNFDNIHHTTAFRDIVDQVFKLTGIEVKQKVCDYDTYDFNMLRCALKELHVLYGYGACINKDVHKLFHDNYGYTNISPYNFLDFVYRIDQGEFNQWFSDNNLEIDINYNYIEYLENILNDLEECIS